MVQRWRLGRLEKQGKKRNRLDDLSFVERFVISPVHTRDEP